MQKMRFPTKIKATLVIVCALSLLLIASELNIFRIPSVQTPSRTNNANTQQPTSTNDSRLLWMQAETGWKASKSAPSCPEKIVLIPPTDLKKVTSILYPGQVRGGNYKPHGGFRFDNAINNKVTVVAPVDGFVVRAARYLEIGEVQYMFDVMSNCGIMYRVDHLNALSPKLATIANSLPTPLEGDSRTHEIKPEVPIKQGEMLATVVGFVKTKNASFDFGLYDYRNENASSKNSQYRQAHTQDRETALNAVCWFDSFGVESAQLIRSLPAADSKMGKKSDYCL